MKKWILIGTILLSFIGYGQSQKSFNTLLNQTNRYLSVYAELPTYEEYYTIKDLDLTKREIKDLINEGSQTGGYFTNESDSIESFDLIMYLNMEILDNLDKLLAHDKFSFESISQLKGDIDFNMVVSEDHNLYNFSLADKHGGTYRSRTSKSLYVHNKLDSVTNKPIKKKVYPSLSGDGLNGIYLLKTSEGDKYVLTGYVRGCSYCFENNIQVIKFEKGEVKVEFDYSVNSRDWGESIIYDQEAKRIHINYVTDDLTTDCNCVNAASGEGYDESNYSELNTKKCHCTFEFNGVNFELVKESWEKYR